MSDWMGDGWMDGYPLDCYDYQSTCGAKKNVFMDAGIAFQIAQKRIIIPKLEIVSSCRFPLKQYMFEATPFQCIVNLLKEHKDFNI